MKGIQIEPQATISLSTFKRTYTKLHHHAKNSNVALALFDCRKIKDSHKFIVTNLNFLQNILDDVIEINSLFLILLATCGVPGAWELRGEYSNVSCLLGILHTSN